MPEIGDIENLEYRTKEHLLRFRARGDRRSKFSGNVPGPIVQDDSNPEWVLIKLISVLWWIWSEVNAIRMHNLPERNRGEYWGINRMVGANIDS